MTLSEIRRRIDALKRKFARELAIIKLRRIAEAVADDWDSRRPPRTRRRHPAHRQSRLRLPTFIRLRRCLEDARRKGEVPYPDDMVLSLLPWADNHRYRELLRWDLPPQPSSPRLLPF